MSEAEDAVDQVSIECDLDAAPEKVWRAITTRELADRWLDLGNGAPDAAYEVVEALPHSRVRYAWHDAGASEPCTEVTIDLSPLPHGGTRFRLTHGQAPAMPRAPANGNRRPAMALAA